MSDQERLLHKDRLYVVLSLFTTLWYVALCLSGIFLVFSILWTMATDLDGTSAFMLYLGLGNAPFFIIACVVTPLLDEAAVNREKNFWREVYARQGEGA